VVFQAVQQLQGSAAADESRPSKIGPISLGAKRTGERKAIRTLRSTWRDWKRGTVERYDTRKRKSETTGNTNFDLHRRASLRPYC
jgi:hypothetical protein